MPKTVRGPLPKTAEQGPRIVTLDIETSPIEAYVWGLFDQNIGLEFIKTEWTILSFTAKWLGEKKVIYMDSGGRGVDKVRDDLALLQELWGILDEADIVVAQNGKQFDVKKIAARLIMNGFGPFSPIRVIDTMLASKKHFGFTSNKLAWLSRHLTKAKKDEHKEFNGFELWKECLADNPRAWAAMKKYNNVDVIATEELYLKLRPWIDQHPNLAAYVDLELLVCPKCGSDRLQKRGRTVTQTSVYQRYHCQECEGWSRSRATTNTKEKRKSLLSN